MSVIHSTPRQVPALISANPIFGRQPASRASQRRLRLTFGTACGEALSQEMLGSAASPNPSTGPSAAVGTFSGPGKPRALGLHGLFCSSAKWGLALGKEREGLSPGNRHRAGAGDPQGLLPSPLPGGVRGAEQPVPTAVTGRLLENFKTEAKPRFPSPPILVEIKTEIGSLWRAEPPSPLLLE